MRLEKYWKINRVSIKNKKNWKLKNHRGKRNVAVRNKRYKRKNWKSKYGNYRNNKQEIMYNIMKLCRIMKEVKIVDTIRIGARKVKEEIKSENEIW